MSSGEIRLLPERRPALRWRESVSGLCASPGEGEDEWVVSVYRPSEEIQFVRFNGRRVIRYSITLTDNGDRTTEAEWRQVVTGLNEEGKRLLEGRTIRRGIGGPCRRKSAASGIGASSMACSRKGSVAA